MNFRISLHSGSGAPSDALDLLWVRLEAGRHEEVRFARAGKEIRAAWGEDAPVSFERDERSEIGRGAVLEIVKDVCERAADLRSDWFAVAPLTR